MLKYLHPSFHQDVQQDYFGYLKTLNEKIDSFHRRLLRRVLNIRWPKIIKSEEVYNRTKVKKWSNVVKKRRLSWVGHLLRLDKNTPARIALKEACRTVKRKSGPKSTWINLIKSDLKNSHLNLNANETNNETFLEELEIICKDRNKWRDEIRSMML